MERKPTVVLPGILWRFLKWISPLLLAFVAFVLITGVGYWLACFVLHCNYWNSAALVFIIPGMLYAPIFVLASRNRVRTWRRFVIPPTISAATVFVLVLALHFARPGPTRFDFLKGKGVAFEMMSPTPGSFEWVYTFPGDFLKVAGLAEMELSAKGFQVDRKSGKFQAYMLNADRNVNHSLSIYPRRAVGKHFMTDGDMLEFDATPGWITVDLFQSDIYPMWLSIFIP